MVSNQSAASERVRPNILFVLSDDQGPWALGCAGSDEIQTPVLDGLAARGTRLENFFCVSPVCSPARASLMTGQIPSRHGVHDYLTGVEVGANAPDYLAGQPLFTDVLAEGGYQLGLSGKWHLGANDASRRGFVHWYGLEGGGSPYRQATMYRDGSRETVTDYLTDVITADALAFLDGAAPGPDPFFLAVNYTAPHKPWKGQHPREFEALYDDCAFESCPQEPAHPWQPTVDGIPIGGEADVRAALVGYFAAVSAMDAGIGALLERLETLGQTENTLVIFSSDNGFNCGHHGIWGKGNGTFPQNMYDSSVKVPAIFTWPGHIAAGSVRPELLSAYDVAATILELAGLDKSGFEDGPGQSFAGLIAHEAGPVRAEVSRTAPARAVVVYDEYGPVRMIRTATWKYVHRYPHGPHELYHLGVDPQERSNLIHEASAGDTLADLRAELARWFSKHASAAFDGAALPVAGAGQFQPLGADPLAAFTAPNWDGTAGDKRPSSAK
ncbi:sulfatase-like hydrolase/transferase [Paenarthrobacter sp. PH39-S1]|uniref:sulfatase-like hydrolase/transferase n=1 Tax=Paenarthrobacter sp. PH39-S1 TaxID=3046204 RepID=UPI0024B92935|nr:sulfatase-like hydrolase/transferase [Paenarthrobacter sp. PH39-S1]MDJ0354596.1 sulfatase-like hydrolase/transferase [Paenarthrobacter sp. PH39-S1]